MATNLVPMVSSSSRHTKRRRPWEQGWMATPQLQLKFMQCALQKENYILSKIYIEYTDLQL